MFSLAVWFALASGVAFLALGIVMLATRTWREQNVMFAAFAMAWGLQITVANLARGLDEPLLVFAFLPLLPLVGLLLVTFSTGFPSPGARPQWGSAAVGGFAVATVVSVFLFLVRPSAIVEALVSSERGVIQQFTDLAPFLLQAPFYGAFYVAAVHLTRVWSTAGGVTRKQSAVLLGGILLFIAYAPIAWVGALWPAPVARAALGMLWLVQLGIAVVGLPILGLISWIIWRHGQGRERSLLLASIGVPLTAAVVEGAVAFYQGGGQAPTLGLWRLLSVVIIAYGIAKYQLFDLDLKAHFAVRHGGTSAALVAIFFVVSELIETQLALEGLVASVAGAAAIALALVPVHKATERVADGLFPSLRVDPDPFQHRREEIYQGAVERAFADGEIIERERKVLDHLRESLGIPRDVSEALEAQAAAVAA